MDGVVDAADIADDVVADGAVKAVDERPEKIVSVRLEKVVAVRFEKVVAVISVKNAVAEKGAEADDVIRTSIK